MAPCSPPPRAAAPPNGGASLRARLRKRVVGRTWRLLLCAVVGGAVVRVLLRALAGRGGCAAARAAAYGRDRGRARAVALGPGVVEGTRLRVLLERLTGRVTVGGGLVEDCLSGPCPARARAVAVFVDAENLALEPAATFDRVVAVARAPRDALYTEAVLASAAGAHAPRRRVRGPFADEHARRYAALLAWARAAPHALLVRAEALADDAAARGALGEWARVAAFLDPGILESALRWRAPCAFDPDGIAAETAVRLTPEELYPRTANKTQFMPDVWDAIPQLLFEESCAFGFLTERPCPAQESNI